MDQEEKQRNYDIAEVLLSEQNFTAALIVGAIATLLTAVSYGIVTSIADFSYGFAAAGVGIVIGLSMQYLGRGIDTKFAVAAAGYTIAGCILGNVFRYNMNLVRAILSSPLEVFQNEELLAIVGRTISYLSFVDMVFWSVAVFAAVFLARRPLSRSDRLAIGIYELKS